MYQRLSQSFIGFSVQWYEEQWELETIPTITWTSSRKQNHNLNLNHVIELIPKNMRIQKLVKHLFPQKSVFLLWVSLWEKGDFLIASKLIKF